MIMIWRRYRNGIKTFGFLLQHFPPVFVILCLWEIIDGFSSPSIIHITQECNISFATFEKIGYIAFSFSANANAGYGQAVTRCYETFTTQYKPGNNKKTCTGYGCIFYEFSSGIRVFWHIVFFRHKKYLYVSFTKL